MRYFVLGFFLLCILVVSIAGFRGDTMRHTPIEVFPDMDRQPKLRPQTDNSFFGSGLSSQVHVEGTVARGSAFENNALNTGKIAGTTNWVEVSPIAITEGQMQKGSHNYRIYCAVCHGAGGDGKGVTMKYGMVGMANFHDPRLVEMTDGEIYNTITHGKNLMGGYGSSIDIKDRWAVVAYVRALQRSRLAKDSEIPEAARAALK
ncbi:cytochrome c [Verrucomicrobia bacterium]|nr:cytochrome c [Verrucomicrobiota bacterium]